MARRALRFCADRNVPHSRCGKFIVSVTHDDDQELLALFERGKANGSRASRSSMRRSCDRASRTFAPRRLWSPSSGIVEAESLVRALAADCDALGVARLNDTAALSGAVDPAGLVVTPDANRSRARVVVNAAGLYADEVSAALGGEAFTIHPAAANTASWRLCAATWSGGWSIRCRIRRAIVLAST